MQLSDEEISEKLANSPLFEHINNEKMSPKFLRLSKFNETEAKMCDITRDDLTVFDTNTDRKNYIHEYYENLYKADLDTLANHEGCIENFLGPDLLNHPTVTNSKLTLNEKNSLEGALSALELDRAVKECKKNSAGGMDGINNSFIKKF